ncbi:CTTNBP 2 amino-terminal-like protein [Parasponia andersonii]|uniref:CTTNBP 2 amino-terminal-like protein n=1 Tax=Parasponia andersonii TaxID=3476 RepID=A0A2P5E4Y6_PARAD|nr:CTTNBP 2 amino-terminal-like protein [Parasponia andersonii]
MGEDQGLSTIAPVPPVMAALNSEREEYWRHVDNSVNAVSFGFVATAILISMFLLMAIFEKFLRSRSSSSSQRNNSTSHTTITRLGLEAQEQIVYGGKLDYSSPKMTVYASGVSVLMPGEEVPTFIAHPAPAPCPPEGILRPLHTQNDHSFNLSSNATSSQNQI